MLRFIICGLLLVCACGEVRAGEPLQSGSRPHRVTIGAAVGDTPGGPAFTGSSWRFSSSGFLTLPLAVPVDCNLVSWAIRLRKHASSSQFVATFGYADDGVVVGIGPSQIADIGATGLLTLEGRADHIVQPRRAYAVTLSRSVGSPDDFVYWAEAIADCPNY